MEETGEVEERGKRAWKMERMKEKEEKSLFILLKRMKLAAGGEKWKIASKMGEREREENMCVNKAQGQGEKHKRRNSRKATEERKTEGERALKENSDKLLKRMSDFHCPGQRDEGLDKGDYVYRHNQFLLDNIEGSREGDQIMEFAGSIINGEMKRWTADKDKWRDLANQSEELKQT
ncbi:hypothetical protein M8J77_021216 [Diaphorina citri]|nr:hypothetical protein M8J77_021216 [Diaphorina citri]